MVNQKLTNKRTQTLSFLAIKFKNCQIYRETGAISSENLSLKLNRVEDSIKIQSLLYTETHSKFEFK